MRNKAFSKKILCLVVIGSLMSPTLAFAQSSTLVVTQPINNSAALTKDETVFTSLDSNGVVKSTSVTSWIHSDNMVSELKDKSNLTNIKNLKGSETPTKSGDSLVWKTDKNDIFYSGDSNKTLPISVKIVYYLNDKEISAKDLAGKTGKVKIKIDFDNNTKKMVNINGKARTVCESIPITTIIDMPVGNFSKITAVDGTIMKVGNNNVLTFISVPGFQESLGLKNGDLGVTLANSIVVTADAKDFKLAPIYFAASPDLLDLDNVLGGPAILGDLTAKLADAKTKLPQLESGVKQLDAGLGTLQSKVATMNTGLQSQIAPGASTLAGGLSTLSDGLQTAKPGANALAGGLSTLNDGLQTAKPGAAELSGGLSLLDQGLLNTKVDADGDPLGLVKGINTLSAGINAGYTGVSTQISPGIKSVLAGYSKDSANGPSMVTAIGGLYYIVQQLKANPLIGVALKVVPAVDASGKAVLNPRTGTQYNVMDLMVDLSSGLYAQTINSKTPSNSATLTMLDALQQLYSGITGLSSADFTTKLPNQQNYLEPGMAAASRGAGKLKTGISGTKGTGDSYDATDTKGLAYSVDKLLLPGSQQLSGGITQAADGVKTQMLPGAKQLSSGITQAADGVKTQMLPGAQKLSGGITQVANGVKNEMVPGIAQLKAGSSQIAAGINPLLAKINPLLTTIDDVMAAKDEMIKIAKENTSFSGVDPSMQESLKFVMQTQDIKVTDSNTKKEVKTEKKTFWDKVYDAFAK